MASISPLGFEAIPVRSATARRTHIALAEAGLEKVIEASLVVRKLTEELEDLRIQIDEVKKERQVAEITGSDYFKNLQARAREMRSKVKGRDKT